MPELHEYAFACTLLATVRVKAPSEQEARAALRAEIDGADAHLGAWPDGGRIEFPVSLEGEADLEQVDGEDVP